MERLTFQFHSSPSLYTLGRMMIREFPCKMATLATLVAAAFLCRPAPASEIGQTIATQFDVANFQNYLDNLLYTICLR
jgi:hypothetical protein